MKLFFRNIIALLSVSAAVCSCMMAESRFGDFASAADGSILITGTVSELDTAKPLQDIKITFRAYSANDKENIPVLTEEVRSGEDGVFLIRAFHATTPLLCRITAEDTAYNYESQAHEINVTWSGPSYDRMSNSFIVNDSHFQLSKIRIKSF